MSRSSVEAFIKSAANLGDKKEYEKVLQSALRVGPAEFINDLKVKYPLQDPPVVEEAAVEGSEAATSAV